MQIVKKIIKELLSFLEQLFGMSIFLVKITKNGNWFHRFPLQAKNGKTITLLANAPSLKDVLPRLLKDVEFQNTDYVVLNFFANTPEFFLIKPIHYCFADPMFFKKNHNYEKVRKLFDILQNQVDWEMNIYVPNEKRFKKFSGITNPHIQIKTVKSEEYKGFECFRHSFYQKGLCAPIFSTVAILAIYVGINQGYNRIRLYGVDHTFFNGLCVNEQNQVCMQEVHFYETNVNMKPIMRNDNDQLWKMSDYIYSIYMMFKSHDELANYAKKVGVDILNCTQCSLIDSYPRMK